MADYYPLLARAVAGLDINTGENRRALYERARTALVNQLRGVDPPLDESDITRERLALEDAIRRLETEASKRRQEEVGSDAKSDVSAEPEPESAPDTLREQALRDFRGTVAEAEGLGEAAAEANRSARHAYEDIGDETPVPAGHTEADTELSDKPPAADAGFARDVRDIPDDEPVEPATHYFEPEEPLRPVEAERPDTHQADVYTPPAESLETVEPHTPPLHQRRSAPLSPEPDDDDTAYPRPGRSFGGLIKALVILLLIGAVGGAGYWQRDTIASVYKKMTASTAPAPTPAPTAEVPTGRPKITDRIGATNDSTAQPSTAPAAAVAQKVVLYDEDPSDPQGKRYVGSAVWRTETVSPGAGLAPELAIRADVEIPERRMRMTWSLRRNTDRALPASHTIEVMFSLPADFSEGGISNVPGMLMKQNEQARGLPLAGLSVKVTNNYFLIGLSSVQVDKERNVQLLKERDWFDIPIVYTSGKRAILAVEKGTPGGRAFEESFRAWGE